MSHFFSIMILFSLFTQGDNNIETYTTMELSSRRWFINTDTLYNTTGNYAWIGSKLLNSNIILYEVTKEKQWLYKFIELADHIIQHRDDALFRKDWNGEIQPGWSETRKWKPNIGNVDDKIPVRYLVDDALIAAPYARFSAAILKKAAGLKDTSILVKKAKEYFIRVKEVADYHIRHEWRKNEGVFISKKGTPIWWDGVNVPRNYEAAFGILLIYLNEIQRDAQYSSIIAKIVKSFKNSFKVVDSCYVWSYWGGMGYNGWKDNNNISKNTKHSSGQKTIEDIHHGAIDIYFITLARKYGYGFDKTDMKYLISTLRNNIIQQDKTSLYLDGKGNTDLEVQGWFELASNDSTILDRLIGRISPVNTKDSSQLIKLAYLILYRHNIEPQ